MTPRRALDWVLIVALTGTWAVVFAFGVGEGLRNGWARFDGFPTALSGWGSAVEPGEVIWH